MTIDAFDPRGLIRESYNIDGIHEGECRTIFLDWALFDDHEVPQKARIEVLLAHYGALHPDHPMTGILREALTETDRPRRRGGRRGRSA